MATTDRQERKAVQPTERVVLHKTTIADIASEYVGEAAGGVGDFLGSSEEVWRVVGATTARTAEMACKQIATARGLVGDFVAPPVRSWNVTTIEEDYDDAFASTLNKLREAVALIGDPDQARDLVAAYERGLRAYRRHERQEEPVAVAESDDDSPFFEESS